MVGLEGRFEANQGDLVVLKANPKIHGNDSDVIGGFVVRYDNKKVVLTHESTTNKLPFRVFPGERRYSLACFSNYEIRGNSHT